MSDQVHFQNLSVQVLDEELEDFRVRKRREVSNKEVREECLHFVDRKSVV